MTLTLKGFTVRGYRSLRRISYPVSQLDVFVGANGVGKSNLFRSLALARAAADNSLGRELAAEGLRSALWAGPRRRDEPTGLELSVDLAAAGAAGHFRYEVSVGFPAPTAGAFPGEPQVKTESLSYVTRARAHRLVDRKGASVMVRDGSGRPGDLDIDVLPSETILGRLEDPANHPELDQVRRTLLEWRLYHDLRTDPASPLRRPCVAVASPTLDADGSNLAAVFATLSQIRQDTADLDRVIDHAFPGTRLVSEAEGEARFALTYPDFPNRLFQAAELSDGTLRFLALAGALMGYRLPPFIALNEPETSLHPDLMEPLGEMIVEAARRTQVWLVTHSERLAAVIARSGEGAVRTVVKAEGATTVEGLTLMRTFRDEDD
ncbi:MAG: AAA family ATPase [Phenylobacterium sp.]|uniref:AAA family ATPase n=1 Tax=Phenylobacterium sp. TaxID=1871053 RepID=UPI003919ADFD